MSSYKLVKNYKDNSELRKSFNELAYNTFGISFESWYLNNFWQERYQPFSFVDGNRVIANVSVNVLDLIIFGESKRAIQIGTVMTDPIYRNRGLSRKLMNEVLETYENKYDVMYLFANQSVLGFYPKFGFHPVEEYQHTIGLTNVKSNGKSRIQKLDGNRKEDLHFIYKFASNRIPVSSNFATRHTQELLMYYCINIFPNNIYYLEDEDVIIIYEIQNDDIHLYDLISKEKIRFEKIIDYLATNNAQKVVFHYTPDYEGFEFEIKLFHDETVLFVKKKNDVVLPTQFKHPITAQA